MDKERIKEFIAKLPLTVVEVMSQIDGHAAEAGLVFIVDDSESLIGCITDGDIRRWILRGGELNSPAVDVMHKNPIYKRQGVNAGKEYYCCTYCRWQQ